MWTKTLLQQPEMSQIKYLDVSGLTQNYCIARTDAHTQQLKLDTTTTEHHANLLLWQPQFPLLLPPTIHLCHYLFKRCSFPSTVANMNQILWFFLLSPLILLLIFPPLNKQANNRVSHRASWTSLIPPQSPFLLLFLSLFLCVFALCVPGMWL